MRPPTPEGQQKIAELAQRYNVSPDAVLTLFRALIDGRGTMAQFDHPEFGGRGQWMQGGMVMVGDMFNHTLKAKVTELCTALVSLFAADFLLDAPAVSRCTVLSAAAGSPLSREQRGAASSQLICGAAGRVSHLMVASGPWNPGGNRKPEFYTLRIFPRESTIGH